MGLGRHGLVAGEPAGADEEDVAGEEGGVLGGGDGLELGEGDGKGGEWVVGDALGCSPRCPVEKDATAGDGLISNA